MSIKGSSIRWLEAALQRGDLLSAWSAAHEIPRLPLDHALALVILAASEVDGADRFDRAARRWLGLYLREATGSTLEETRAFVDCLDDLPDMSAATTLAELCQTRHLTVSAAALQHLAPRLQSPTSPDLPRRRR